MPSFPEEQANSNCDTQILATLFGVEDTLGQKPLSWPELADLGATLNPTEAEQYIVNGGLDDYERSDIYCSLFQYHPELRAVLKPKFRKGPNHFIARIAPRGGPDPLKEFKWIVGCAQKSASRMAWLPLRAQGVAWKPAQNRQSRCIVLFRDKDGRLSTLVAEIVERRESMPSDGHIEDFYREHTEFNSWWRIARPRCTKLESLDQIPGWSRNGNSATQTFAGQANFVYWDFDQTGVGQLPSEPQSLFLPPA